jgi:beta-lactamase class A
MTVADLSRVVDGLVDEVPGRVAYYGRNLTTGEQIARDAERRVSTGSAAKSLICLTYAQQVADGLLDPERRVVVTSDHLERIGGSGVLRYCRPGLEPTLSDLTHLMITVSDNIATDLVLEAVGGRAAVNAVTARIGAADAQVAAESAWVMPPEVFGLASPLALAESYAVLADPDARGYPAAAAELARAVFRRHGNLDNLSRHLPWSIYAIDFGIDMPVTVFSKSGSYPGVQCEAGLYETADATWVVAVMFDELTSWSSGAAGPMSTALADVGKAVFDAWAHRAEAATRG